MGEPDHMAQIVGGGILRFISPVTGLEKVAETEIHNSVRLISANFGIPFQDSSSPAMTSLLSSHFLRLSLRHKSHLISSSAVSVSNVDSKHLHTTNSLLELRKLARVRCVDNSAIGKQAMAEGRPPKIIHVYNKKAIATIGDKVLCTVKGEMKKAIVVGVKKHQKHGIPRSDTNNIVFIDDNGTPLGTRISAPIPMLLRKVLKEKTLSKGADYTKVLAIASRFV